MDDTKRIISKSVLTATADAIRAKDGTSATITPADFATKIAAISTEKPEEVANVTPTTSAQTINPTSGRVFSSINVSAVTSSIDNNIQAANIKKGTTILGVTGTLESGGNNQRITTVNLPTVPTTGNRYGQSATNPLPEGQYKMSDLGTFDGTLYYNGTHAYNTYNNSGTEKTGKVDLGTSTPVGKASMYLGDQVLVLGNYNGDNRGCYYDTDEGSSTKYAGAYYNWNYKGSGSYTEINDNYFGTDGTNIYYSNGSTQYYIVKSDNHTANVYKKTGQGLTNFYGNYIGTDGTNIYYSQGSTQYKLNIATSTGEPMTGTGKASFFGSDVGKYRNEIYLGGNYKLTNNNTGTSTSFGYKSLLDSDMYYFRLGRFIDGKLYYINYSNNNVYSLLDLSAPIERY